MITGSTSNVLPTNADVQALYVTDSAIVQTSPFEVYSTGSLGGDQPTMKKHLCYFLLFLLMN